MLPFKLYLREARKQAVDSSQPLRLVLGNTSGDMDSIVGAMGLAYYYTLKTHKLWTPVVNCAKSDLRLKAEIYKHVVLDCGISVDDLLYWDELIALKRPIEEICLIDHNVIDEA
jgi:inorganic pyrophosphatase/exopolyphosphatase